MVDLYKIIHIWMWKTWFFVSAHFHWIIFNYPLKEVFVFLLFHNKTFCYFVLAHTATKQKIQKKTHTQYTWDIFIASIVIHQTFDAHDWASKLEGRKMLLFQQYPTTTTTKKWPKSSKSAHLSVIRSIGILVHWISDISTQFSCSSIWFLIHHLNIMRVCDYVQNKFLEIRMR